MNTADTHIYARWLLDTRGDRAEIHVADAQKKAEAAGQTTEAENWRKIRASIREMRGSHVS